MTETNNTYVTFEENPFIQKGWVCPKCGRVFSPSVSECLYCNQVTITYTTGPLDTAGRPIPLK